MIQTDIVIVGGGAVGHVIARGLLAHTSFSVALVEANQYSASAHHPGFDARVIALAKRTVDELSSLGIDVNHAGAVPIRHIQVSDKGAAGLCQLNASDFHVDHFGKVVSLHQLGAALQIAPDTDDFTLLCPLTVDTVERKQDGVLLSLSDGQQVSARLVVLADGGRSGLDEQLGFERQEDDYGQTAVIVNALTQKPHNHKAYERFTSQGPLAFLPYDPGLASGQENDQGFSVVWTVPPEKVDNVMSLGDNDFKRLLQQAFGWRQGAITQVGERSAYPLVLKQVTTPVTHRAVVCGNAAQSLHPIAGQGFNLGLRDAIGLVKTLAKADDPGAFSVLREYQQSRSKDKQATITLTDGLVRLFSNNNRGLTGLRNVGLVAMDNCPSLKQAFVRQTTGFAPGA
ncbi:2-octaprenyl-6-methoxyphenyl hydroxylase [Alteromonas confluentis]|uniref:FAD-binding domain-containing protein n=1 Tax=Alteromonas confluentis TaxID=1656094 RepID=A0A1E7ZCX3_9ALTE|nr:2-octaprenyl-6-methoxyphenyl hydroxylase [Alteromonas confluentis]OFC71375.1 hypothetical protein BFC18_09495 [Alteromonas confluentis]